MKMPPTEWVKQIQAYDANLRVRWSHDKSKWVIEAKTEIRNPSLPPAFEWKNVGGIFAKVRIPETSDRYIGARDGYYQVLYFSKFNRAVMAALSATDNAPLATGERAKLADKSDEVAEKKAQREVDNHAEAFAKDVYDTMKVKTGETTHVGSTGNVSDGRWY
jgi:hypothetical protein